MHLDFPVHLLVKPRAGLYRIHRTTNFRSQALVPFLGRPRLSNLLQRHAVVNHLAKAIVDGAHGVTHVHQVAAIRQLSVARHEHSLGSRHGRRKVVSCR
jgi:hypothetical protein